MVIITSLWFFYAPIYEKYARYKKSCFNDVLQISVEESG